MNNASVNKGLIYKAFIAPLKSRERIKLYIASIIATFGFSGAFLYLAFDSGSKGIEVMMSFMLSRTAIVDMTLMPLAFIGLRKFSNSHFFKFLFVGQIAVLGILMWVDTLVLSDVTEAFAKSVLLATMMLPYWISYHAVMIEFTSDDNSGNDVSVSLIGIGIGTILGSFCGGAALQYFQSNWYIVISLACILGGTIMQMSLVHRDNFNLKGGKIIDSFIKRPHRTANTIMDGICGFLIVMAAPVWLGAIGMKGLGTGIAASAQTILKIVLSPFTGVLTNAGKGRETTYGSIMNTLGWLPWLVLQSPWILIWSYALWGMGYHLYGVGLTSRWYQERTYANMAAREFLLGVGRMAGCLFCLPLVYTNIWLFFAICTALTFTKYLVSHVEAKKL